MVLTGTPDWRAALPIFMVVSLLANLPEIGRYGRRDKRFGRFPWRRGTCYKQCTGGHDGARNMRRKHLKCFRSEEHTSELQSLMRISYAVFCLKKKNTKQTDDTYNT